MDSARAFARPPRWMGFYLNLFSQSLPRLVLVAAGIPALSMREGAGVEVHVLPNFGVGGAYIEGFVVFWFVLLGAKFVGIGTCQDKLVRGRVHLSLKKDELLRNVATRCTVTALV